MALDFSKMRFRITLQRVSNVPMPGGELQEYWSDVGTYWANIENLAGRELAYAQQVVATATHKVSMRNVGLITAEDRFQYADANGNTQTLNIGYVNCVGNLNEAYELLVTEQKTP